MIIEKSNENEAPGVLENDFVPNLGLFFFSNKLGNNRKHFIFLKPEGQSMYVEKEKCVLLHVKHFLSF